MSQIQPEELSYQALFLKLQALTQNLSRGEDEDLQQVLISVEEGYKMIGLLREKLAQAQQKVETLRTEFEGQET